MSNCLEIGPFPSFITKDHKESLLHHFGAIKVIHLKKKLKENYMIGIFPSHQECKNALLNLHQVNIQENTLVAVYSKRNIEDLISERNIENLLTVKASRKNESTLIRNIQNYEAKLSAISAKFDILHPISPLLRYAYPPPSPAVLANIVHHLVGVTKFYTQVLHLMNKMNLPCPFGKAAPTNVTVTVDSQTEKISTKTVTVDDPVETEERTEVTDSSESEIDTDEDVKKLFSVKPNKAAKRTKRSGPKINKKPRLDQLEQSFNIQPREQRDVADLTTVFDATEINKPNNLQLNLPNETTICPTADTFTTEQGFGKIIPVEMTTNQKPERKEFITFAEIESNKISEAEWPIVPVFKNYKSGEPNNVLYVKNLAKVTTEQDLKYVFGKYVNWCFPEEVSEFSIKRMKEGKMKGQAFISFPSIEAAKKAIEEVNGYILKDKPMVVAYSKRKTT